jgi:hypothetical protein
MGHFLGAQIPRFPKGPSGPFSPWLPPLVPQGQSLSLSLQERPKWAMEALTGGSAVKVMASWFDLGSVQGLSAH